MQHEVCVSLVRLERRGLDMSTQYGRSSYLTGDGASMLLLERVNTIFGQPAFVEQSARAVTEQLRQLVIAVSDMKSTQD